MPAADAAEFVQDRFDARPTRYDIVVHLHAPAGDVEQVVAVTGGRVEPVDDHTCRLHMSVDAFDWPVMILAAVRAEFDVVQPAEFRDHIHAMSELFMRAGGPRQASESSGP